MRLWIYRMYLRVLSADALELEASVLYVYQSQAGHALMPRRSRAWAAERVLERVQAV